jgi:hypothetical protein
MTTLHASRMRKNDKFVRGGGCNKPLGDRLGNASSSVLS